MGSSFKSFSNIILCGVVLFGFNAYASLDDCSLKAFVTDSNNQPITSTLAYQIDFYSTATSTSTLTTAENGLTSPTAEGMVDVSYSCPSFLGQRTVFLELTINGVVQSPRIEVTSVPSAIIAQSALSLDSSFTIDTNQISDAAVGTNQIASGAVTASRLAATGVTAATYGSSSTVPQIAVNAQGQITSASSVAISVAPSGTAGGSLTGTYPNPTLTTDSVGTTNISDSAVTTAKINNDAVTTAKISDGTIATADLADSSVTSAKISDGTIASGDIAGDALDFSHFSDAMTLDASTDISVTGSNVLSITNSGTGNSFIVNDQAADSTPFVVDNSGNVGIGNPSPSGRLVVSPPATQVVSAGDTITADACGTIKKVDSLFLGTTTNTTDTFTRPSASNDGCCMDIIYVGGSTLNLDANAFFKTVGGADISMDPYDAVRVCSTGAGGVWVQVSPLAVNN